jgi:hypothetical protein
MDTQLEEANDSERNGRQSNTAPEKPKAVADEVENVMPDNSVDSIKNLKKSSAVKGDDSDGQITWTVQSRIAACCLVTIYVGKSFSKSNTKFPT